MTRVDFYQLSRDPVHDVVPRLAQLVMKAGERLLIVANDEALLKRLSDALWAAGDGAFLANGMASGEHADRQPILLSTQCDAANGAKMALLADGKWREEAERFARVLLTFDADATDAARNLWRALDQRGDIDNRIHKQTPQGGWREGR